MDSAEGQLHGAPGKSSSSFTQSRNWYAWNVKTPPDPDEFHVTGQVQVTGLGIDVQLATRQAQGINPRVLLLDLLLIQRSGDWPQEAAWKEVRFDKLLLDADYRRVDVFLADRVIASIPVEESR